MKCTCGTCESYKATSAPYACCDCPENDPPCAEYWPADPVAAWGYAIIEGITRAARFRAYRRIVERAELALTVD